MSWSADPELQEMFLTELDERSARLMEGARAMRSESVESDVAGAMMREGHTIKGTSRVMGFETLAVAGELVEFVWRSIQKDDMDADRELAMALEMVARAIPDAGRGDPETVTADLIDAMTWLGELTPAFEMPELPEPAPSDDEAPAVEAADEVDVAPEPELEDVDEVDVAPEPELEDVDEVDVAPEPELEADDEAAELEADDEAAELEADDEAVEADDEAAEVETEEPDPEAESAVPVMTDMEDEPAVEPAVEPAIVNMEISEDLLLPAPRQRTPRPRPEGELGGLVGAVEGWAHEHTLMVNAGRLFELMNHIAEMRLETQAMVARIDRAVEGDDSPIARQARGSARAMRVASERIQVEALALGAVPLTGITSTLPQLVRFLAGKLGRKAKLEILADEHLGVDREVIDRLGDSLRQIVVNAVYHGIEDPEIREQLDKPEEGTITLTAVLKERMLEVTVADDGAGVDWELIRAIAIEDKRLANPNASEEALRAVLFQPGFTTRADEDTLGGGGGLDDVASAVESLYGRVVIESTAGQGTEIRITVPAWRSLQRILVVDAGGVGWGIPEAAVDEVMPLAEIEVEQVGEERSIQWRGQMIPVESLAKAMGAEEVDEELHVVVLHHRVGNAALTVSAVDGVREVAVKELSPVVSGPDHVAGAAFLGGEDVVLVVEPGRVVTLSQKVPAIERPDARVLVVDDSMGARAVVSGSLASSGFTTSVAASVAEALEVLAQVDVDALVVDYAMPNADGVSLVEAVRKRHDHLPIIMLSGVADEADRERARLAGVDAFFDKAGFREGAIAETLWQMLQD